MIVLSIGSDKKIFEQGSHTQQRMREYGALFDELHIVVFSLSKQKFNSLQISSNTWAYPTNSLSRFFMIGKAFLISLDILKKRRIEKSNFVLTVQDPFEAGLVGLMLKWYASVRLHVQVHIDFYSPYFSSESLKQKIQVYIAPFILRRADRVRVVSSRIQKHVIEKIGIDSSKVDVLPILATLTHVHSSEVNTDIRTRYPQFKSYLLVASRLVRQKNIPLAFCALRQLMRHDPRVGLIVVGSGPEEASLKYLVTMLGIAKNVMFEPWVNNLAAYYSSADVFLLPSNYEGWGLTAIEACMYGAPVVMTDVGCAGDFIHNGVNGLVVPVGDCKALTSAIKRILDDEVLKKTLSIEAKKSTQDLMSREKYLGFYQETIEKTGFRAIM